MARSSDVAIVFVGTNQDVLREELDRANWDLPGAQGDLIQAAVAANPKTIVVLITAGPLAVDWAEANVPAIMTAFYDGQAQGTAIADVLFGDTNPARRLSTSWYKGNATLPPIEDYDIRKGRTYLYYDGAALYPFGHGLSYTTFAYDRLRLSPNTIGATGMTTVSVDVANVGSRPGDEVVLLYSHDAQGTTPRPIRQLRGFRRMHLTVEQPATVSFALKARDLAHWDVANHAWRLDHGSFEIFVGSSSADIRAHDFLTIGR